MNYKYIVLYGHFIEVTYQLVLAEYCRDYNVLVTISRVV